MKTAAPEPGVILFIARHDVQPAPSMHHNWRAEQIKVSVPLQVREVIKMLKVKGWIRENMLVKRWKWANMLVKVPVN